MIGWRLHSLGEEAARNAAHAGARSVLLGALFFVVVTLVALEDATALHRSVILREELRAAGANVVVIEPSAGSDPVGISAAECAALIEHPYVQRAGAVLSDEFVHVHGNRSQLYRLVVVSPGAAQIIVDGPSGVSGMGALLGPALGDQLGLNEGSVLSAQSDTTDLGRYVVDDVIDLDRRIPTLGRAALVVGPAIGGTEQCLVEVEEAYAGAARAGELMGTFSAPPRTLTTRSLLPRGQFDRSPVGEYRDRLTWWLWLPSSSAVASVWFLLLSARRAEFALYASFLVRRPGRVVLAMTEFFLIAIPALGTAVLICLIVAVLDGFGSLATETMLRAVVRVAAAIGVATGLATWLGLRGAIADQLKDR